MSATALLRTFLHIYSDITLLQKLYKHTHIHNIYIYMCVHNVCIYISATALLREGRVEWFCWVVVLVSLTFVI